MRSKGFHPFLDKTIPGKTIILLKLLPTKLPLLRKKLKLPVVFLYMATIPTHFLQTIPCPLLEPPVQSSLPKSIRRVSFWSKTPAGENTQAPQSAERRDAVLNISSPPTTGIATPGFAGFLKSGW
uniref:Uncharacterized protein n=1 Tax=Salix viminalis TaxID=40686 RepID=A0A6N2N9T9_SALVM